MRGQRTSTRRSGPYVRNDSVRDARVPETRRRGAPCRARAQSSVPGELFGGGEDERLLRVRALRRIRMGAARGCARAGRRTEACRPACSVRGIAPHLRPPPGPWVDSTGRGPRCRRESVAPSGGSTSTTSGRGVENSNGKSARSTSPSRERAPAATVTVKALEPGSGRSGTNSTPWVPRNRHVPATGTPSAAEAPEPPRRTTRIAGTFAVSGASASRMARLKSTVTAGSARFVTPCGPANTTAKGAAAEDDAGPADGPSVARGATRGGPPGRQLRTNAQRTSDAPRVNFGFFMCGPVCPRPTTLPVSPSALGRDEQHQRCDRFTISP